MASNPYARNRSTGGASGLRITGSDRLRAVGRRLKAEGDRNLRLGMLREFREAGKPLVDDIKESARTTLPRGGGLADLVAGSKWAVRTRLAGKHPSVQVRGSSTAAVLRRLNAGRLRHPVFGNKRVYVNQRVASGWFSKPVEKHHVTFRHGVEDAMRATQRRITGGAL